MMNKIMGTLIVAACCNFYALLGAFDVRIVISLNTMFMMIFIFKIYEHYINHNKKEK